MATIANVLYFLSVLAQKNGLQKQVSTTTVLKQVVGQVPPNNHVQTQPVVPVIGAKMVPIQITLPIQPGSDTKRVLTIQVRQKL